MGRGSTTETEMPPTGRNLLNRQEVAQLAGVPLTVVDKAIEAEVLDPERGEHGATLLNAESVIVIRLISGDEITLPREAKLMVKKWVYEKHPHLASGQPELTLSPHFILRCDAEIRNLGKRLQNYLTGRDRYIERNPHIFGGEPVIKGTRLMVRAIADRIADGDSIEALREDYPNIPNRAFETALLYAGTHPRRGRPRKPWRTSEGDKTTSRISRSPLNTRR